MYPSQYKPYDDIYAAVQRQKAVSAYFTSKQILPFSFAEQYGGIKGSPTWSCGSLVGWTLGPTPICLIWDQAFANLDI